MDNHFMLLCFAAGLPLALINGALIFYGRSYDIKKLGVIGLIVGLLMIYYFIDWCRHGRHFN